jgi:hypothetical protein
LSKTKPGIKWNAASEERKKRITLLLNEGNKKYTELFRRLKAEGQKMAKATLTQCLDDMKDKEGSILKASVRGKQGAYSLVRSNPLVKKRLKWAVQVDPNLQQLSEKDFVNSWFNALSFNFVALLNDLAVAGKSGDAKRLENQVQSDIQDFIQLMKLFGNVSVYRMTRGTLNPDKLRKVQSKMHVRLKKQLLLEQENIQLSTNEKISEAQK